MDQGEITQALNALFETPGWGRFREKWDERRGLALRELRELDPLDPLQQHQIIRAQQVLDDYDFIFGDGDSLAQWTLVADAGVENPIGYNAG